MPRSPLPTPARPEDARPLRVFGQELSAAKGCTRGTHRTCEPAQTLERFAPLMAPCGVTRLADITGLDCIGLPVFSAVRPNGAVLAMAQGKGLDAAAAKASALMEALEWWHAENVDVPLRLSPGRTLGTRGAAADAARLPEARRPYDPAEPLLWLQADDLLGSQPTWVPFDCVSLVRRERAREPAFRGSANGLASGNHPLEAVLHGLYEVIERDATAAWSAGGAHPSLRPDGRPNLPLARRELDLRTVDDPDCRRLLDLVERAQLEVSCWDLTADTGVPVYGCALMERPDPARMRAMMVHSGFGCHLSTAIALARALTEAIQVRTACVAGGRDTLTRQMFAALRNPRWQQRVSQAARAGRARRRFVRADHSGATFQEDIRRVCAQLRRIGVSQVLVADLARPEFGLPVVKVLVPGLHGTTRGARVRPFRPERA